MPIVISSLTPDVYGDVTPIPTTLLFQQSRKIGELIPDIVVEEVCDDTLQTTKHPVEVGATISDHAFRMPSTLVMKIAYSDSKHKQTGFVSQIYQKMLRIAGDRELLTVVTGKRIYQNMVITGIHVKTDETTEYVLDATVLMEEIIIADTEVTSFLVLPAAEIPGMSPTVPVGSVLPSPASVLGLPEIPFSPIIGYIGSSSGLSIP